MSDSPQGPGWWQASDGRWYPPSERSQQSPMGAAPSPPTEWYRKPAAIIGFLVCLWPIGLVLMWVAAPWKQKTKLIVTGGFAVALVIGAVANAIEQDKKRDLATTDTSAPATAVAPTSTTTTPREEATSTSASTTRPERTTTTTRATTTTEEPTTTTIATPTTPAPPPVWSGALAARCSSGWRATFSADTDEEVVRVVWYNDADLGPVYDPPDVTLSMQVLAADGNAVFQMNIDGQPAPATVTVITDEGTDSFSTTFAAVPTTRVLIEMPFDEVVHLDRLRGAPTVTAQVDLNGCDIFAAP